MPIRSTKLAKTVHNDCRIMLCLQIAIHSQLSLL